MDTLLFSIEEIGLNVQVEEVVLNFETVVEEIVIPQVTEDIHISVEDTAIIFQVDSVGVSTHSNSGSEFIHVSSGVTVGKESSGVIDDSLITTRCKKWIISVVQLVTDKSMSFEVLSTITSTSVDFTMYAIVGERVPISLNLVKSSNNQSVVFTLNNHSSFDYLISLMRFDV